MVRVVLGGTFEYLHAGHSRLVEEAFRILKTSGGGIVHIGLTSDKMAAGKSHSVSNYDTRKQILMDFISELIQELELPDDCYLISELEDSFGPSVSENYDYIVVSPETRAGADKINKIRRENGLLPIQIIEIKFVLAEDTIPISSTRIYKGEIDKEGRVRRGGQN